MLNHDYCRYAFSLTLSLLWLKQFNPTEKHAVHYSWNCYGKRTECCDISEGGQKNKINKETSTEWINGNNEESYILH
jgi:hypothetical protein